MGVTVAAVMMIAGYLLGYAQGRAEGRTMWKSVFQELHDFDDRDSPAN
jgi:hypothetical protein